MKNFDKKQLIEILEAGNQAPSADNCQPWFFVIKDEHLELFHDIENTHSNDLYNLEYFADHVTMGCVLENIRNAAEYFGFKADIKISSEKEFSKSGKIAEIFFPPLEKSEEPHFFEYIKKRTTNRKKFNKKRIPQELISEIQETAVKLKGRVILIEDKKELKKIAKIIALHDKVLWKEEKMRENLTRMLRFNKNINDDGLTLKSLELGVISLIFPILVRIAVKIPLIWNLMPIGSAKITKDLVKSSGAVGILIMESEDKKHDPVSFIKGGLALQKIWLYSTKNNMHLHPMYGPLALVINKKIGKGGLKKKHGWIQDKTYNFFEENFPSKKNEHKVALFRIGYAKNPSDKSRRKDVKSKIRINYTST